MTPIPKLDRTILDHYSKSLNKRQLATPVSIVPCSWSTSQYGNPIHVPVESLIEGLIAYLEYGGRLT